MHAKTGNVVQSTRTGRKLDWGLKGFRVSDALCGVCAGVLSTPLAMAQSTQRFTRFTMKKISGKQACA